jgi:hypothetical protein
MFYSDGTDMFYNGVAYMLQEWSRLKKIKKKLKIQKILKVNGEDLRVSDTHDGPKIPVELGDSSHFGTIHG